MTDYNEKVLEDDYPVFEGYWYLVDGEPTQSPLKGDVSDLRRALHDSKSTAEIRSCDCVGRELPLYGATVTTEESEVVPKITVTKVEIDLPEDDEPETYVAAAGKGKDKK